MRTSGKVRSPPLRRTCVKPTDVSHFDPKFCRINRASGKPSSLANRAIPFGQSKGKIEFSFGARWQIKAPKLAATHRFKFALLRVLRAAYLSSVCTN
jgi:hypothetical protein